MYLPQCFHNTFDQRFIRAQRTRILELFLFETLGIRDWTGHLHSKPNTPNTGQVRCNMNSKSHKTACSAIRGGGGKNVSDVIWYYYWIQPLTLCLSTVDIVTLIDKSQKIQQHTDTSYFAHGFVKRRGNRYQSMSWRQYQSALVFWLLVSLHTKFNVI